MSVSEAQPQVTPTAAMARWQAVFARLLKTEGARFVDNPNDQGGATKYGLSLRFLAQSDALPASLKAQIDIDHSCQIDAADIAAMTVDEAEAVYYDVFWPLAERLPIPLDAAVFDQSVNDGPRPAVMLLQKALNDLPCPGALSCSEDGALGPVTERRLALAVRLHGISAILAGYRVQAANRYRAIVANNPSQAEFLNGWLARAGELGNV